MRLIDADALSTKVIFVCEDGYDGADMVLNKDIDNAPTIEAEPVTHGRWNKTKIISASYYGLLNGWECSSCKYSFEDRNKLQKYPKFMNYCPHCGAKMDGGSE